MSIVKYTNKKTGVVTWYESTSHYDPLTKQSRPIRKYLGKEDPVTGELIPSSGKRGRKSGSDKVPAGPSMTAESQAPLQSRIQKLEKENLRQQSRISSLETENRALRDTIRKFRAHLEQMNSLVATADTAAKD